jgi:cephalosporin hydroxylase
MKLLSILVFALGTSEAAPVKLRKASGSAHVALQANASSFGDARASTFSQYYDSHATGRGIWKWNNALVAYDRHFAPYINQPVKFMEVGVQSGGSIEMWQNVLGDKCEFYGMDINPETMRFNVPGKVTIALGDQGDPAMWAHFFQHTTKSIDILVDDGGHEPHQMLTTLQSAWPHTSEGGFVSIEDIHGQGKYFDNFFAPAAQFLGMEASKGTVDSVHMYPFVLIAQKSGGPDPHQLKFSGSAVEVTEFQEIWDAIHSSQNWGNHIILRNKGWGPFLTAQGIHNFLLHFQDLHGANWYDTPTGCERTAAAVCTNKVVPTKVQAEVTGIHIFKDHLVVEVPGTPVTIQAVRRGSVWIGYGL